jgi:hypothetical protein
MTENPASRVPALCRIGCGLVLLGAQLSAGCGRSPLQRGADRAGDGGVDRVTPGGALPDAGGPDAATSDGTSGDGTSGDGDLTLMNVFGTVELIGETDHSGARVALAPLGLTTTTDAAGHFAFAAVPSGVYTLSIDRRDHHELVPSFIVSASGSGVPYQGGLVPLEPIEVPRARRMITDPAPIGAFESQVNSYELGPSSGWETDGVQVLLKGPCDRAADCANASGGTPQRLFIGKLGETARPVGGPLGTPFRFTLTLGGERAIYMTETVHGDVHTTAFHLVTTDEVPRELASFPAKSATLKSDLTWAAVVRADNGIERVDFETGQRTVLAPANSQEAHRLFLEQAPGYVVYTLGKDTSCGQGIFDTCGTMRMVPSDGSGPPTTIDSDVLVGSGFMELGPTPDGGRIFYIKSEIVDGVAHATYWTSPVARPQPEKLADNRPGGGLFDAGYISPDHETVYFTRDGAGGLASLYAYSVASSKISLLADGLCRPSTSLVNFSVAVGSVSSILFVNDCDAQTSLGTLRRVDSDSGQIVTLAKNTVLPASVWAVAEGAILLYQLPGGSPSGWPEGALFEVKPDGTGLEELSPAADGGQLVFDKDNTRILFKGAPGNQPGSLVLRRFGDASAILAQNVSSWTVTDDLAQVLALTDVDATKSGTMRLVQVARGASEMLDSGRIIPESMQVTPGGHGAVYVVSGGADKSSGTLKLAGGGVTRTLGDKVSRVGVLLAPKAGAVVFGTGDIGDLKMAKLADGTVTTLGHGVQFYKLSPDGLHLSFLSDTTASSWRGTLRSARLDTAAVTTVLSRTEIFGWAGDFLTASRRPALPGFGFQDGVYTTRVP